MLSLYSLPHVLFSPGSPHLPSPAGLLVPHRGEVRRHAEGQGAAASAAAAGAADAAAQQCDHLGEPDGPGGAHSTVSGSKSSRLHLRSHLLFFSLFHIHQKKKLKTVRFPPSSSIHSKI